MRIFGKRGAHQWRGVIAEYRRWLPVTDQTPVISLHEGGTPLVYAEVLSKMLGNEIWSFQRALSRTPKLSRHAKCGGRL